MNKSSVGSSFRDPSGNVFKRKGGIYRNINNVYAKEYQLLIQSGLYKKLSQAKLLIPHKEIISHSLGVFKVIKPVRIPFISYPYEWNFSQLKDAALTTLKIQKIALEHGMVLKDASSYNIQFFQGNPILIDTLSFNKYTEGDPWVAYRQFCMHFLAPLVLMSYKNIYLNRLMHIYADGIPLSLTSSLLPVYTWLNPSLLVHIHLHSKAENHFKNKELNPKKASVGKFGLPGLINSLESAILNIKLKDKNDSVWVDYYQDNNYSTKSFKEKNKIVLGMVKEIKPDTVWDLGGNTGKFSHMIAGFCKNVICFDNDVYALEVNYQHCKANKINNCLPLVMDLTNPSPSSGWAHKERASLLQRGPADAVLALALIHHMTIANNIPFEETAAFLSKLCKYLIIEFIPKEDSQVQRLLRIRNDIFVHYNMDSFERIFSALFVIRKKTRIQGSLRHVYLMKRRPIDKI